MFDKTVQKKQAKNNFKGGFEFIDTQ